MREFPTVEEFKAKLAEIDGKTMFEMTENHDRCPIEVVLGTFGFENPRVGYGIYSQVDGDTQSINNLPYYASILRETIDIKCRDEKGDIFRANWQKMTGDEVLALMK